MQKPITDGMPDLSPEDLVEELREAAQEATDDLNEDMPEKAFELGLAKKFFVEDDLQWWAADCIERLVKRIEELEAELKAIKRVNAPVDIAPTHLVPLSEPASK